MKCESVAYVASYMHTRTGTVYLKFLFKIFYICKCLCVMYMCMRVEGV